MSERVLDHIGIAVASLDRAIPVWEPVVGAGVAMREVVQSQGVEVAFLGSGSARIELLTPTRPDSPVARFLDRRGPGMHHLCYRVENIRQALAELEDQGYDPIDREPRAGAFGHLVAFLHPRTSTGVLVELLEARPHR